jgi:hypothetical protein
MKPECFTMAKAKIKITKGWLSIQNGEIDGGGGNLVVGSKPFTLTKRLYNNSLLSGKN